MKQVLNWAMLFFTVSAFSQHALTFNSTVDFEPDETAIELQSNKLVSSYSFNKLIFEDVSYLLLGGSAPSEGLEAAFDESKSNIALSGIVTSNDWFILSVKGDLSATDEGIYFIDEQNGSKKAKIALNFYRPFWGRRSYDSPRTSVASQRAFYTIEKAKQYKIAALLKDYYYTTYLLEDAGIPVKHILNDELDQFCDDLLNNHKYLLDRTLIDRDSILLDTSYIVAKKLKGVPKNNAFKVTIETKDTTVDVPIAIYDDLTYDINKVISLYDKTVSAMDSISEKLVLEEHKIAQPYWNSKRLFYAGASPYYARETIKNVYKSNDTLDFAGQFTDTPGDLFGIEGQFGFFYQSKKGFLLPRIFFTRLTVNLGRGSNLGEFENRTYNFPARILDTISSGVVSTPQSKEGNYNKKGNEYNFGFLSELGLEAYYFPFERYGIFGQVGYSNINFDPGKGEDAELYSMRLGLLMNLKAKEKNFATLQLFADRSDLSKSPNGNDNNLLFGFKVGVPFNFKQKL
ncbi:hypothetical protein [Leeuwenhoekiella parthenopeia]|uniref:Outer membrane protein n=1 Tax=Leeuwenhoekiella parthenopeia TaxID=2890320 RepID=A0ABS8GZT1_9FLAO|nr:hypothetical protein [Leeuwenhoekiella parthenopeia]MCC4214717.1 hypothetical protein [Leeuwenhoekiella parthenopeia]